jgi:hypothetical protein
MLQGTKPKKEAIGLDSSKEIFSAREDNGFVRSALAPSDMKPGSRTFRLLGIANLLIEYCNAPEGDRNNKATAIARAASELCTDLVRK